MQKINSFDWVSVGDRVYVHGDINEGGTIYYKDDEEFRVEWDDNSPDTFFSENEIPYCWTIYMESYDFKQNEMAQGGQEQETDNAYIERWFLSRNDSVWNIDGIQSELLKLEGVKSAMVDENYEMTTNSKGLEGKSIVAIVDGGRDEDIALAIWRKKDQAIKTIGDTCKTIKDNQGNERKICFYRPKKKGVKVKISFTVAQGENILEENLLGIVKEYIKNVKVGEYITSYKCESEYIRLVYPADKLLYIDISFKFSETAGEQYEKVL
jgi:hypothetical protein